MPLEDIPFCEVYYPTNSEFQDFYGYVEKLSKTNKSGIVKIIPPKNWQPRKDLYKNIDFTIPGPIEQIVSGRDGVYELVYLQRESRSFSRYKKLVEGFDKNFNQNKLFNIEKKFWKTLKFSSPLYGADAPGSLFDKGVLWNLAEIPSILKEGLTKDLKGVTSPYLYIGCWKSMFSWHKEDLDLSSINYLHFGKPKCWYGIHPNDDIKINELAEKYYPNSQKECSEFMRHKTFLINPEIIHQKGINIYKCIQMPGEFVITFGGSYHAGFNMGLNCAEAVNFATKNWIDIGIRANFCKCQKDSVQIAMRDFVNSLYQKKIIKKKELDSYNMEIEKVAIKHKESREIISIETYDEESDDSVKKARKKKIVNTKTKIQRGKDKIKNKKSKILEEKNIQRKKRVEKFPVKFFKKINSDNQETSDKFQLKKPQNTFLKMKSKD